MSRNQFDSGPTKKTLLLTVHSEVDGSTTEYTFDSQPVRIGRNPKNDVVLNHQYVSGWHAEMGFIGGAPHIMQVGSSNSAQVEGRKLRAGEAAALSGEESIRIVPFRISVRVKGRGQRPAEPRISTQPLPIGASFGIFEALDQVSRRLLGRAARDEHEAADLALRMEQVLMQLLGLFIALKQGQEQFEESVEVKTAASDKDELLRGIHEPGGLAALLLAPDNAKALAALEAAGKSITVHQVALLKGLMAGVRRLIGKLSPAAVIHEATKEHRTPGYKVLWETFVLVYQDLAEEGSETFKALFGPQFSKSYSRLMDKNL